MPRYCDACRTFITSRDSLTIKRHSDDSHFSLPLGTVKTCTEKQRHARLFTADHAPAPAPRNSGAPVSALSHPQTTGVKRLTPAVVLRIGVILRNSRVIMGTVLYMCKDGSAITTTNCGFTVFC